MSSTINQKQSLWKAVEVSLRSTLVEIGTDGITVLTAEDAATWSKTLILNCLILQDLLPDGSRLRTDGSLKQWIFSMAKVDILSLANGMKEFQKFIRNYPNEWSFLSYSDFKHRFPYRFTGDFWSPVKDYLISYLADPCSADFKVLNQWVSFPLKLTLKGIADDLSVIAEEEYLINEERLAKLVLSDSVCNDIATVLGRWFKGFSYSQDFRPHHSNGAVSNRNTKLGLLGKYRRMASDTRISSLYKKFGIDETEYGFSTRTLQPPRAKLITVPKGIDKRRSICPEPAEYQFNQQGVWDLLDDYIASHPVLSRHISIHDQSVNQEAALLASSYLDASTIDLSSASDSVSWRLIKRVCVHCPQLLWMLWATRSKEVKLPSGRVITTNKYAPMGSALCFPMESILFAAICQVADDHTNVRTRDTYHVYGDDIVAPAPIFEEVSDILHVCGFLINEQKTFDPYSRYKESCGVEGLDGVNVSVIGISRKFSGLPLTQDRPELVSCYISLANQLFAEGYMVARTYVLASVLALPASLIPPFSEIEGVGIRSTNPTNWQAIARYNSKIMQDEVLVGCLTSQSDPSSFTTDQVLLDQKFGVDYHDIRYHETLRRLARTRRSSLSWPDDLIKVSLSKSTLKLSARWLPTYWFEAIHPSMGLIELDFFSEHLSLYFDKEERDRVWMEKE